MSCHLQQEALSYQEGVGQKNWVNRTFQSDWTIHLLVRDTNNLAGTDAFVFPMIGITIPLYRNKYKAMVNEVVLSAGSQGIMKNPIKMNLLETILENAWKEYLDADRRIQLYMFTARIWPINL